MGDWESEHEIRKFREQMRERTREEATSILTLAGLRPIRMWELANGYWPDVPTYDDVRKPWWLARTVLGLIRLGWRKRVLEIDWEDTGLREVVTADDVTKSETMVHAYSQEKAVEYLKRLRDRSFNVTPEATREDLVRELGRLRRTLMKGVE